MKTTWILLGVFYISLLLVGCGGTDTVTRAVISPTAHQEVLESSPPTRQAVSQLPELAPTYTRTVSPTLPAVETAGPPTQARTPGPTPSPTPLGCWKAGGHLVTGSLQTRYLRLPLDFRLHLPPCYDVESRRHYPVLYLIHGQSYTDDQWDRLGADEIADALAAAGEVTPFIIVMPRDRTGDQPPQDGFARAVVEVLIPYVDNNYRTLTDRVYRAVGGLSRGAGWSVHLGLVYWELFGALGAHSPAIFHEDARLMRVYLDDIPPKSLPRIFVDVGEKDQPEIYDAAFWFERVLDEKDVPHDWYLFPGYHEEAYWQAHMEKYLRWYAREW